MRRISFAASVGSAAILAAAAFPLEIRAAAPVVRFKAPVYDFGQVVSGDPIEHVFQFTNSGNATLEILGVYPACHCTIPGDYTRQVTPGQTGQVTLLLDTTDLQGPVTKTTVVSTTDPAHFNLVLSFKGTVWKPIEIVPATLVLRPILGEDSGATNSVRLISHLSQPLTLGVPATDNPALTPELATLIPGREFRLSVRTGAVARASMAQGTISLKTGSSRLPVLAIPVLIMPRARATAAH